MVRRPTRERHDLTDRLADAARRADTLAAIEARRLLGDPTWLADDVQAGLVALADRLAVDLDELRRCAA